MRELTYNATNRILYQAVDTKRLVRYHPIRATSEMRLLYLTPKVASILRGEANEKIGFPGLETEVLVGRFCSGHLVTVSLLGSNTKSPDFEKLEGIDEVWAICARKPKSSQVRVFGRFAAPGVFVGLQMHERIDLASRYKYNSVASTIPQQWSDLFGNLDPFRATKVEDYFGGVVRNVDED